MSIKTGELPARISEREREGMGRVSVVSVLYNSAGVIENLLDSINRTNKEGLVGEVVIVDNSSQDDGASVVEKYISEHAQNSEYEIKLVKNNKNLGFGRGNNIGARLATKSFILFSNPDIEFKDSVVEEMVDLLTHNPRVGLVGPRMPLSYVNPVLNPPPFILQTFLANSRFGRLLGVKPIQVGEYSKSFQVVGAFMMARRNDFLNVGGFDEENFLYLEELQLSERLRNAGLETVKLWTSQEIGHQIGHSQFIKTGVQQQSPIGKTELYRQAEEHYIINYMHNLTGNKIVDFLIRQTVRSIYKMKDIYLFRPLYQKWLTYVSRDVIQDQAKRESD